MMNKEEYIKAVIAMWDSMRNDFFKGRDDCIGVRCSECPLSDTDAYCCDCCNQAKYIFDVYNIIEKWSKEHQPKKHKVSQLEYDILKTYSDSNFDYYFNSSDLLMSLLSKGYFDGATISMRIIDYFNNCEVA